MITIDNYKEQVAHITYSSLPENLQKGFDFVKKSTKDYSNWDVYYQSKKIKEVIDLYFQKVATFVKKPVEQKIHIVKPTHGESAPTVKKEKTIKASKPKAEPKEKSNADDVNFSERLAEEIKLIKRFVNLHGKTKKQDEILRFINTLQKAIVERKVRKTSVYAKQIEYIQDHLIKTYNAMGAKITYEISSKQLADMAKIVGDEKVYPAMLYIKKFLNLVGKTGIKQKATQLSTQLAKAVKSGKIKRDDKYAEKLNDIFKTLMDFIDSPTKKTIELNEEELSGLNGIIESCKCSVDGLEYTKPQIMNSMDFANMQFNTIGLQGKFRKLIGDPSPNFTVQIFGKPKMGKSYLSIDFAGHLARYHGKVLYVAVEEGLDFTLQKKLNEKDVKHPNLFVASVLPREITTYDFIFLDSVNKLGLNPEDLIELKKKYPTKSFVFIFQTTKEGSFRGSNIFQHDVDVVVEVPTKGRAIGMGRFSQGGEIEIFNEEQLHDS